MLYINKTKSSFSLKIKTKGCKNPIKINIMKSIKKFKVGDKVKTNQDYFQEYEGTVIEIETKPHPYRSSDKDLTWLRISYHFRNGSFSTCSTSVFN